MRTTCVRNESDDLIEPVNCFAAAKIPSNNISSLNRCDDFVRVYSLIQLIFLRLTELARVVALCELLRCVSLETMKRAFRHFAEGHSIG